jgi:hypothetical protein
MNTHQIMVLYRARIVEAHRLKKLREAAKVAAKRKEIADIDAQLKREMPRPTLDLFGGKVK